MLQDNINMETERVLKVDSSGTELMVESSSLGYCHTAILKCFCSY